MYVSTPQRTQYAASEAADDRRNERNNYDYDERIKLEYEDSPQLPLQTRRTTAHHNVERVKLFKLTAYYFYQMISLQSPMYNIQLNSK